MAEDRYTNYRVSSWDNNGTSTSSAPLLSVPNISSTPVSRTANYVVPYSKYTSQVSPQNNIDGRQMQQYQQPMNQSQTLSTFQPTQTNTSNVSQPGWCEKHVSVTQVIGLLVGLVVAGIPLVVIVTLYVQLNTSSGNTASASSSNTGSSALPYQCSNYASLSEYYRISTYTSCGLSVCDSFNNWYRVTGAAGTVLATSPVSVGGCGSSYPVWFNGSLPTTRGSTTMGTGCVNSGGNLCYSPYSVYPVLATNCDGFYVFYLPALTCICCSCNYPRYCTV